MRYFTSDHHFNHNRILELTGRPFSCVAEMNREIMRRHNSIVTPQDTVYFLGDVCMGQIVESLPIVNQLNGHKILITGNHDRPSICYPHKTEEKRLSFVKMYSEYFNEIHGEMVIDIGGRPSLLTHFPYWTEWYTDHAEHEQKLQSFMPRREDYDADIWHLCGHVHKKDKILNDREIHVGVDAWDFYPASEEQIIRLMEE